MLNPHDEFMARMPPNWGTAPIFFRAYAPAGNLYGRGAVGYKTVAARFARRTKAGGVIFNHDFSNSPTANPVGGLIFDLGGRDMRFLKLFAMFAMISGTVSSAFGVTCAAGISIVDYNSGLYCLCNEKYWGDTRTAACQDGSCCARCPTAPNGACYSLGCGQQSGTTIGWAAPNSNGTGNLFVTDCHTHHAGGSGTCTPTVSTITGGTLTSDMGCYYNESARAYIPRAVHESLECNDGYYKAGTALACTSVGSGYYSPKGSLTRSECPNRSNPQSASKMGEFIVSISSSSPQARITDCTKTYTTVTTSTTPIEYGGTPYSDTVGTFYFGNNINTTIASCNYTN